MSEDQKQILERELSKSEELKLLANKRDVPYQSLLKIYLSEKISQELHS